MLWRLRADFSAVAVSAGEQYRPPELFELGPGDRVVDGGAYNGDTLRALGSAFAKAWAIEPDPANAARLRAESDERVVVIESALGEATSDARFSAGQGVASTLSSEGNISVRVSTLDDLLEQESPTFVKLDIEGAEFGALAGSRHLLARSQPIVAVCVYHRPDDIWRIPLQLRDLVPHHRYFLRAHEYDGFEVVAYAVPPNRLLARPTSLDSA
jgi:FkbM family methyltransferase